MSEPRPIWKLTTDWVLAADSDQLQNAYIKLRALEGQYRRDNPLTPWHNTPDRLREIVEAIGLLMGRMSELGVTVPDTRPPHDWEAIL